MACSGIFLRSLREITPKKLFHRPTSSKAIRSTSALLSKYRGSTSAAKIQSCVITPRKYYNVYNGSDSGSDTYRDENAPKSDKLAILENTAKAPWLFSVSPNIEDRLRTSYILAIQLSLYLDHPSHQDQNVHFLTALGTAPVSPQSDIGRARKAIANIMRAVVRQISSIPFSSSLRKEKHEIFDVFGALQTLHDTYLEDEESVADFRKWSEFWARCLPVVSELCKQLDQKGYGLLQEDLDELYKEEAKKKGL